VLGRVSSEEDEWMDAYQAPVELSEGWDAATCGGSGRCLVVTGGEVLAFGGLFADGVFDSRAVEEAGASFLE
jgi:hypothetical protein